MLARVFHIVGLFALLLQANAQAPGLLTWQGRIAVGANAFNGTGQFKFALVNGLNSAALWRNAPDANNDGQPDSAVSLNVSRGLYAVALGDTQLSNMAALPTGIFVNGAIYLRVWFSDGVAGFEQLLPDQRVTSAGYALMAANVADGSVTVSKLGSDVSGSLAGLNAQLNALSAQVAAQADSINSLQSQLEAATPSGLTVVSTQSNDADLDAQGYIRFSSLQPAPWISHMAETLTPSARYGHSTVWADGQMIVWGGNVGGGFWTAGGGKFDPALNAWAEISNVGAPAARAGHTAVWTGDRMIVWGGKSTTVQNTGGIFLKAAQRWTATSLTDPATARESHVAVWTGARMIVWGGQNGPLVTTNRILDPVANQWTALNETAPPAARVHATAVWTGAEMIVWGGLGLSGYLSSGGRLSVIGGVTPGAWSAMNLTGAPSGRKGHTAIWTGSRMIVWGGTTVSGFVNDGAAYNPANNTWTALPALGAPSARSGHAAVWTGSEMIIIGGETPTGATASSAAFNPVSNQWRTLTGLGSPLARTGVGAVWTGAEILVFGGSSGATPLASLQRLDPQPAWHFYRKP